MTFRISLRGRSSREIDRTPGERGGVALFLLLALVFAPVFCAHVACLMGEAGAVAAPAAQAPAEPSPR